MDEDPTLAAWDWFKRWSEYLPANARDEFETAIVTVRECAEDECAYAMAQVENDHDGWIAPDELAEYYVALPLDEHGAPIHDAVLVMPDGSVVG